MKGMGVKPGDRIYAVFDEKSKSVTLKSRKQLIEEMMADLKEIREEAIRRNPQIAINIKRDAGKSIEQIRDEWDRTPEGRKYYKEKYGLEFKN